MESGDPRQTLLRLAGEAGVSLAQLSALIGRNASYLQQFIRKGSPRKLEEGDRATLARFFGVAEDVLGGPEEKSRESAGKPSRGDWVDVTRLGIDAAAGPGAVAAGEEAIGAFRFSSRWLRRNGLDPAMLSAIAVAGDSMEPTLRDGDEILVDRTPRPLADGIHVVRRDDALLVKRVSVARPGAVVLLSDNGAYPPVEAPASEIEVIGRVVWKSGRL